MANSSVVEYSRASSAFLTPRFATSRCQCHKVLFSSSLLLLRNKLDRLSTRMLFSSKTNIYRLGQEKDPAFPATFRLARKNVSGTNGLAYFGASFLATKKSFITLKIDRNMFAANLGNSTNEYIR